MNVFMSAEIRINVRTTAEVKRELEITARLRGIKVSSLVNLLVVRAIREEKEREPGAFASIAGTYNQTGEKVPAQTETNNAVIVGTPVFPELAEVKPKKKRAG